MRRSNKYGARRALGWQGRMFDSTAERDYATELALRAAAGDVTDVVLQPKVQLTTLVSYKPDFSLVEDARRVWIDVKGVETDEWKVKAKLWRDTCPACGHGFGPGLLRIVKRQRRGSAFVVTKEILGGRHGA